MTGLKRKRAAISTLLGILGFAFFIINLFALGSVSRIESLVNAYVLPLSKKKEILEHYEPMIKETRESIGFEILNIDEGINLETNLLDSLVPIRCLYIPGAPSPELLAPVDARRYIIFAKKNYQTNKSTRDVLAGYKVIYISPSQQIFSHEPKRPVFFEIDEQFSIQKVFMSYSKISRNSLYLNAIK